MGTLSCLLAATASIAALTTGCALKPVQVTGKESNGSQSETAFTINRVGDVARLTVAYNDGTDHPAIQYTATTRVTKKGATHMGWSHSTSTEQSTAVSSTRGPYFGVNSWRFKPRVPSPASTAACGSEISVL